MLGLRSTYCSIPMTAGTSLNSAQYLSLNSSLQSTSDSLNSTNPNDYYRIYLAGRSSLNLSVTGLSSDANLQLLDGSGQTLHQSANTGSLAESINVSDLRAGTYYIQVSLGSTAQATNYSLEYQAQSATQPTIFWRNYQTGQTGYWQMNGTSIVTTGLLDTIPDPYWDLEGSKDFNGDGQADLLGCN